MFPFGNLAAPETRLPFFGLAPVLASDAEKSSSPHPRGLFERGVGAGADSFDCPGRTIDFCHGECYNRCTFAGVAKSVDAADLKSAGTKLPYRSESGHRHQKQNPPFMGAFVFLVSFDGLGREFPNGNSLWFCTVKQPSKHSALCKTGATVRSSAPKSNGDTLVVFSLLFRFGFGGFEREFPNGNSLWFCTAKQHGKHSALCKTGATCGSL